MDSHLEPIVADIGLVQEPICLSTEPAKSPLVWRQLSEVKVGQAFLPVFWSVCLTAAAGVALVYSARVKDAYAANTAK
jgi:hypothetical protein